MIFLYAVDKSVIIPDSLWPVTTTMAFILVLIIYNATGVYSHSLSTTDRSYSRNVNLVAGNAV